MTKDQKPTWDDIKEMYVETDRRFKETEQLINKNAQQVKETDLRFDKQLAEYRLWREEMQKLDKRFAETAAEMERLSKHLGGISKNNGDMAEQFFFNAFRRDKIFMGEKYDRIHKGYFSTVDPYRNEFDIVFFNGKNIAIIEVKYKARPENVDIEHLISRIEHFKKYAREYKNHNIYIGVAAMSFQSGFATKLHKHGIVTIHPVGKNMVIYDKNVKVF